MASSQRALRPIDLFPGNQLEQPALICQNSCCLQPWLHFSHGVQGLMHPSNLSGHVMFALTSCLHPKEMECIVPFAYIHVRLRIVLGPSMEISWQSLSVPRDSYHSWLRFSQRSSMDLQAMGHVPWNYPPVERIDKGTSCFL